MSLNQNQVGFLFFQLDNSGFYINFSGDLLKFFARYVLKIWRYLISQFLFLFLPKITFCALVEELQMASIDAKDIALKWEPTYLLWYGRCLFSRILQDPRKNNPQNTNLKFWKNRIKPKTHCFTPDLLIFSRGTLWASIGLRVLFTELNFSPVCGLDVYSHTQLIEPYIVFVYWNMYWGTKQKFYEIVILSCLTCLSRGKPRALLYFFYTIKCSFMVITVSVSITVCNTPVGQSWWIRLKRCLASPSLLLY